MFTLPIGCNPLSFDYVKIKLTLRYIDFEIMLTFGEKYNSYVITNLKKYDKTCFE